LNHNSNPGKKTVVVQHSTASHVHHFVHEPQNAANSKLGQEIIRCVLLLDGNYLLTLGKDPVQQVHEPISLIITKETYWAPSIFYNSRNWGPLMVSLGNYLEMAHSRFYFLQSHQHDGKLKTQPLADRHVNRCDVKNKSLCCG